MVLVDREVLVEFFPFSTVNMSFHCLLESMVSNEKAAVTLTEDPLYGMSPFLLLLCHLKFNDDVSWCGLLWFYPTWSLLNFLDVQKHVLY